VVSFSSFLDDTARRADLVLPDHVWLERWQDDPSFTSRGFPVLGLQQPVIAPRHDTRRSPEVLADIARRVQGACGEAFPWREFRDLIQLSVRGIYRSGRGSLFDVAESEAWLGLMAKGGWRGSDFGTFEQFWSGLATRGGWWDPVYDFGERSRVLRAAGGKFDFSPVARAVETRGTGQPIHLLGPTSSSPQGYPLQLHLYPLLAAYGDALGPLPFVQDILGREMEQSWTSWVEIAPADARSLRIRDGERVRVESAEGMVQARAKIYPGLRPGVVAMPLGPGGAQGSTLRRALAAGAGALVALDRRGTAGAGAELATWVRVQGV
jgi:anaerobic selenocysteine-containing dehydrogenase